jgi:hypothetical protein
MGLKCESGYAPPMASGGLTKILRVAPLPVAIIVVVIHEFSSQDSSSLTYLVCQVIIAIIIAVGKGDGGTHCKFKEIPNWMCGGQRPCALWTERSAHLVGDRDLIRSGRRASESRTLLRSMQRARFCRRSQNSQRDAFERPQWNSF